MSTPINDNAYAVADIQKVQAQPDKTVAMPKTAVPQSTMVSQDRFDSRKKPDRLTRDLFLGTIATAGLVLLATLVKGKDGEALIKQPLKWLKRSGRSSQETQPLVEAARQNHRPDPTLVDSVLPDNLSVADLAGLDMEQLQAALSRLGTRRSRLMQWLDMYGVTYRQRRLGIQGFTQEHIRRAEIQMRATQEMEDSMRQYAEARMRCHEVEQRLQQARANNDIGAMQAAAPDLARERQTLAALETMCRNAVRQLTQANRAAARFRLSFADPGLGV